MAINSNTAITDLTEQMSLDPRQRLLEVVDSAHQLLKVFLNNSSPGPSGEGGEPAIYQVRIELANVTPVPQGQDSPSPFQVTFTMPIGNN